jgi:8-oxo-dGTP pyrophosphatase MutT (NUDIX family)
VQARMNDLRARLSAFRAHDAEEAGHLARMSQLAESASDVSARSHFEPGHFTASAFILSPERDSLLLILHGKLQRWLQPGGHIEPTDTDLLAAARREAEEETGLAELELLEPAPFDLDVHQIPALRGDPSHAHFDVRFLFRATDRAVRAASDAKAARWVPLREVDLTISDRSVLRAVEKLLR